MIRLRNAIIALAVVASTDAESPQSAEFPQAATFLADGFDLPVGKPDGEGYYKARGYRPNGHLGEDWNGKRVLVTGAGGFIGSHLTERLVELGADVSGLVRLERVPRSAGPAARGTRGPSEYLQADNSRRARFARTPTRTPL